MSAAERINPRPKGYDVSDWLEDHTPEDLRRLITETPEWRPTMRDAAAMPPDPSVIQPPTFPVDVFPPPLRDYVIAGSQALGVPADMVAGPLLGFAAGAIGNSRALQVKPGWVVRSIIWLAIIGAPGSGKSPALDYARHPLDVLQQTAFETYRAEVATWEEEAAVARSQRPPRELPEKPVLAHYFTTDATMEALAFLLGASPGLAMVRDELVGWVRSHDAYRKAGDRQNWLSLWPGSPLKVDRRGAGTLYVPRPTVSVVGGIQPDLLPALAPEAGQADGFIDRFLMSWPEATPTKWTDASVDPEVTTAAETLFSKLRMSPAPADPFITELSADARHAFAGWYDENAELVTQASGLPAGCYAKYPGQCARIALILHCLHHPENLDRSVDVSTVEDAILVMEYFRQHLARVLPSFGAVGVPKGAGLVARVGRLLNQEGGGWVSRTAINNGLGGHTEPADIAATLATLALEGRAESRLVSTGRRPREEWRWRDADLRNYSEFSSQVSDSLDNSVHFRISAAPDGFEEVVV